MFNTPLFPSHLPLLLPTFFFVLSSMLASSFCLLSVLSSVAVLALPSPRLSGPGGPLAMREYGGADFDESDLFNSCPGGSGSQKLERADRCTLVSDGSRFSRGQ